jgi:hypothetical protein
MKNASPTQQRSWTSWNKYTSQSHPAPRALITRRPRADTATQTKQEHADDDAIVDDTAGQAYVEQFAQQTFERGEKVLRANKVTR